MSRKELILIRNIQNIQFHFGNKFTAKKAGGNNMTIPAMYTDTTTPIKKKNITHSSGDGATLTPTKRKLINNCNTRTLLRVFENAAGNPSSKKRRCDSAKGSTNLTNPGD